MSITEQDQTWPVQNRIKHDQEGLDSNKSITWVFKVSIESHKHNNQLVLASNECNQCMDMVVMVAMECHKH